MISRSLSWLRIVRLWQADTSLLVEGKFRKKNRILPPVLFLFALWLAGGVSSAATFEAVDDLVKETNRPMWDVYVNYGDGYGWQATATASGKSKEVFVRNTPVNVDVTNTLDRIYHTTGTNDFLLVVRV